MQRSTKIWTVLSVASFVIDRQSELLKKLSLARLSRCIDGTASIEVVHLQTELKGSATLRSLTAPSAYWILVVRIWHLPPSSPQKFPGNLYVDVVPALDAIME